MFLKLCGPAHSARCWCATSLPRLASWAHPSATSTAPFSAARSRAARTACRTGAPTDAASAACSSTVTPFLPWWVVGIGFGLQNIFSNFISGIIILVEKTLKIGDFVDLQSGVRGTVTEIGMRYTRVTTNDSVDVLVPNSEFINGRVTNWTFNDRSFLPHEIYQGQPAAHARVKIMIGAEPGPESHRDLLINLMDTMPPIEPYARIAEIVDTDPERNRGARERYKQYRERGCTLESHNL